MSSSWKEEFDKRFGHVTVKRPHNKAINFWDGTQEVKAFIETLLKERDEEWRKKVEVLEGEHWNELVNANEQVDLDATST